MKLKIKRPNFSALKKGKKLIKKYILPINWIMCLAGILLLTFCVYEGVNDYLLEQSGNRTMATITSLNYRNDSYIGTISYKVDNHLYEKAITIKQKDLSVNDKIEIKYNKNNPNILIKNKHTIEIVFSFLLSIILLKRSVYFLYDFYKVKKHKVFLKNKGILLYADVNQVYVNTRSKKRKGKYPYRVRLKYTNPTNKEIGTYETEDVYLDMPSILKEKGVLRLPVYLNKENQQDYFIDIEFLLAKKE